MPAATNKEDLIAVTQKEWDKLTSLLDKVAPDIGIRKFEDDISIKDTLTHRAHWIGLFFQWLEEGAEAETPDHGVKWTELKPYNAGLRARYAGMSWQEARDWLADSHDRLLAYLKAADDQLLYGSPMPGGNGKWTTGRYAEASGPSHYRSAVKHVRACLKQI